MLKPQLAPAPGADPSTSHIASSPYDAPKEDCTLVQATDATVTRIHSWQAKRTAAKGGEMKLSLVLETDDDGWVVASCPGLPGCHSQGRTRDEALANIREAAEGYLASKRALSHSTCAASGFELVEVRT